jgi:hypothetical protein
VQLKGQCKENLAEGFFRESSSPKPIKIILGSFLISSKIRGAIRKSRCTTSINDDTDTNTVMGTLSDCLHLTVNLKKNVSIC